MNAIDARGRRPQRDREAEPAIVVPVPVELHVGRADLREEPPREADELFDAVGRDVPCRVAEAEPLGAGVDRRAEQRPQHVGVRPRRVLRDEAERQVRARGRVRGVRHRMHEEVRRPALHELPDRRRADEGVHLDAHPRAIRGPRDPFDVGDDGARRRCRREREPLILDRRAQSERVRLVASARRREPHAHHVDPDPHHRGEQRGLDLDGRVLPRRVLQAVAQRLVDDLDPGRDLADVRNRHAALRLPVERLRLHPIPVEHARVHEIEGGP